ncbi:MAG: ribonuclease P protein component [Desulfobacteraceae bacterium]|nr:ribonuclease P protein component [Desulfobacteraceae bacterium]MBC2757042.1 ribonuclease P protein component [Desulfobacteraceae bacterium]
MKKFGLEKSHKILDRSEYVLLSKCGKKFQDHYFIVAYMPGESECSRLGITVSKRVGNAVIRNRLKRLIREWFRMNKSSIQGCWEFNIIAKKTAAGLASHQVFMSLEKIFGKLGGQQD